MHGVGKTATAALAIISCAGVVRAAEPPSSKRVEITVGAAQGQASSIDEAVKGALGRLPVSVQMQQAESVDPRAIVEPPQTATPAFVRIWIDVTAEGKATVYIVDSTWERILVRRLQLPRDLDEVAREEISYVVRSSVESLLSGAKIGITRQEAQAAIQPAPKPRPRPAPTPVRTDKPRTALVVGAWWEGQMLSGTKVAQGPGVQLGISGTRPTHAVCWGGAHWQFPVENDGSQLGVQLYSFGLEAMGGVHFALLDRMGLLAAAGIGTDIIHVMPYAVQGSPEVQPARWITAGRVRALVGPRLRVQGSSTLWLGLGVDVGLQAQAYQAVRDAEMVDVFRPWQVRPLLELQFATDVARF